MGMQTNVWQDEDGYLEGQGVLSVPQPELAAAVLTRAEQHTAGGAAAVQRGLVRRLGRPHEAVLQAADNLLWLDPRRQLRLPWTVDLRPQRYCCGALGRTRSDRT